MLVLLCWLRHYDPGLEAAPRAELPQARQGVRAAGGQGLIAHFISRCWTSAVVLCSLPLGVLSQVLIPVFALGMPVSLGLQLLTSPPCLLCQGGPKSSVSCSTPTGTGIGLSGKDLDLLRSRYIPSVFSRRHASARHDGARQRLLQALHRVDQSAHQGHARQEQNVTGLLDWLTQLVRASVGTGSTSRTSAHV